MNSNLYRVFAFLSIAAGLSLASCDDIDQSGALNQGTAVTFSPSVGAHGASSRAVNGAWTGGETVGIAMLPSGSAVTSSTEFFQYKVATAGATSTLTPAGEEQTLYYPGSGDKVNFAAFSPYADVSGTSVTYAAFADQSEQAGMEAVDFLYHKGTTDYSKASTGAVALDFNHKLSKVVIQISVDASSTNDIDLSKLTGVTVSNLPASVTFDLADASLTAGADAITTTLCKKDGVYHYEAIVVPHEGGAGNFKSRELTLSFETLGDFTCTLSDELDFMSGNIYTLPFRLSKLGLKQVGDTSITNWADGTITWDSYTLSSTDGPFSIAKGGETKSLSFTTTYPGDKVSAAVTPVNSGDDITWLSIADNNPVKGTIADDQVNYTCNFTAAKNPAGGAQRSAIITISVDKVTKTFTVIQDDPGAIELNSTLEGEVTAVTFAPNAQTDQTLGFKTNYDGTPTVTLSTSITDASAGTPNWITDASLGNPTVDGDYSTYTYTYGASAYTGNNTDPRVAYLHVVAGDKSLVYTISQNPVIIQNINSDSEYSADGGSASFTFETNYSDVDPTASATGSSWITDVTIDDGTPSTSSGFTKYTCSFTLGANVGASVKTRLGKITLSSGNATEDVSVSQAAAITEAASNSYILAPGGNTIYIPVSRANEHAANSIGANDGFEAEFLWADNSKLLTKLETVGIGSTGALKVTSNSSNQGNVVIAVKVNNVIKWSWHIWVTDYKPTSTWMDRNLGATSNKTSTTESDRVKTFGLFYQWGRKDPFPGSAGDTTTAGTEPTIYRSLAATSGSTYAINASTKTEQTISWTVANPESFIASSASWMTGSSDTNWNTTDNKKTIYDPCPAGYRVPTNGSWTDSGWGSFDKGYNNDTYGGWYPAIGRRSNGSGAFSLVGTHGCYWSASSYNATSGYRLYLTTTISPGSYAGNGFGYGVRCIQE